ncbi:MAG TPA: hypothetical protein VND91_08135 [Candidatus Saccharimonadia bacterium]|nr:hypothetical protein [Candidatus Saccharimonadia bacterium]
MLLRNHARYSLALAFVALFAACKKDEEAVATPAAVAKATSTPQAAIESAVGHLKTGNIKALVMSQVPPSHLDEMRANWQKELAEDPPTEQEKKEFETMMAELTASDAEAKLMAKLEPQLVKFESEYAPQLPMMIGMGQGLLQQSVKDNKELTDPQKIEAAKSIDALATWIQTVKFTDRELAKRAVSEVVAAARELDLKTLDQARALDFDTAMEKSGVAYRAAKDVLAAYGLSLDQTLETVKTEVVSEQGDNAKVRVSYVMFEQPMSFETELVKVDGRWYGKQTIEELNKPDEPEVDDDSIGDEGEAMEESSEPVEG